VIKYSKEKVNIDDTYITNNDSWDIIAPLQQTVSIYDSVEKYESDLKKFTQEQRYVFAINWYAADVNNGGHHQFYLNSTGIVYSDALQGLKVIGALEFFKILEESSIKMAGGLSPNRNIRMDFLQEHDIDFEDIDNKFYKLDKTNPLEIFLHNYIGKNKEKFYFEGEIEVSDFDPEKFELI